MEIDRHIRFILMGNLLVGLLEIKRMRMREGEREGGKLTISKGKNSHDLIMKRWGFYPFV